MAFGKIFILNGTSSSGKTNIVSALQKILEEPYLDAGIDKFLWMLPTRFRDRPLWDEVLGLATEAGAIGNQLVSGMHHAIAALSSAGNNVIADHVLVERQWLHECAQLFGDLPTYFVAVRCPLEVLEQREKARKNRTWGQASKQFGIVHAHGIMTLRWTHLRPARKNVLAKSSAGSKIVLRPAHSSGSEVRSTAEIDPIHERRERISRPARRRRTIPQKPWHQK